MSYDASLISNPETWVYFRCRKNWKWLYAACPHLRSDLISEFEVAKLLATMYSDPIKAYNESKRRIHAIAKQEGYLWTGSKWEGNIIRRLSLLQKRLIA